MLELNKVHHGDCLELIKLIPDKSIDLILTDPPYGDGILYGRNKKDILNNENEDINYKIIPLLYDKLKDNKTMYLFTNRKFENKLRKFIEEDTLFTIRMLVVIVKNNIGMGYGFRNQYELCIVCEKGDDVKYNRNDISNVQYMDHINHDESTHPHQKGIYLLKKLIDHTTQHGDIVLDCFGGSGSTAIACKEMKRDFILFELDKRYVEMANKRLATTSESLFN